MLSSIDLNSSVAVYLQIENHVQFAITAGRLSPFDQLPSVRELSERLDVNPNTVAKAYRDLEVMGLLYTRRGKGVFIAEGVKAKCREACLNRIAARIHEVMGEARSAGMDRKVVNSLMEQCVKTKALPYSPPTAKLLKSLKK